MGKGNGLAIVAIIIAIGGCGFGVYAVVILPDTIIQQASGSSEITQIWTVEQAGIFYTGSSYGDMTDMDVTITVNAGETVYVMFNAQTPNGPNPPFSLNSYLFEIRTSFRVFITFNFFWSTFRNNFPPFRTTFRP